jgi:uncharacterized protein YeaO (DUF488 family)
MSLSDINSKKIKIKRAYKPKENSDGFGIFVGRLWPRGIKKEDLQIDVGRKKLLLPLNCANGLITILKMETV